VTSVRFFASATTSMPEPAPRVVKIWVDMLELELVVVSAISGL